MMRLALEQAAVARRTGEVPIGAVLADGARVIAADFNQPIRSCDPTAHAEVVVLRSAARALGNYRVGGVTLYVTVEPCMMCVGAMLQARISSLVFGAHEPKFGAVSSLLELEELSLTHRFTVESGVLAEECGKMLRDFFENRRRNV